VYKYAGVIGITFYAIFVSLVVWLELTRLIQWFGSNVSVRVAEWLVGATFISLLLSFLLIYPIANSGAVGGGSDADDALDIAATELLSGRYPFYVKTYLGNPIAPLPGAILLAIPFVLLGASAYQNLFWLGAFFMTSKLILKDVRSALLLLWTILALSPVVLSNVVTGGDDLTNAIYILIFSFGLIFSTLCTVFHRLKKWIAAILLGIGLSSRSNFILLLPLITSSLAKCVGWRDAIKYISVTCLSCAVVTIPFWLYDPYAFTPVYTQYSKVSQFHTVLPFSGFFISLASGLLAVALAYQYTRDDLRTFLRDSTLVLAIPVVCTAVLSFVEIGATGLIWTGYGVFFLPFSVLAYWAVDFNPEEKTCVA
jgi:hypothetical protein